MNHEEAGQSHVALDGVAPIVTELSRAMHAALLYPAEHRRFAELADPVLGLIRGLAGDGGCFVLEADGAGVSAMGSELPADTDGLSELREVLVAIGVTRVEVDASARRRDLHALLGRLAQGKRRVEVVGEVRDLSFDDLPRTVRAQRRGLERRPRTSGQAPSHGIKLSLGAAGSHHPARPTAHPARPAGPAQSTPAGPAPDDGPQALRLDESGEASRPRIMLRDRVGDPSTEGSASPDSLPLSSQSPDGAEGGGAHDGPKLILHGKANEKALAENTGRRAGDHLDPDTPPESVPKGRRASDNEGRRDLYTALSEGVSLLDALLGTKPPSAGEELDESAPSADQSIAGQPAEVASREASRARARAHMAKQPAEGRRTGPAEPLSLERDGCELTIAELRERIDASATDGEPLTRSDVKDRCEQLSIFLQLLANTSDPAAQRGLGTGLDQLLSEGVAGQEHEILHAALHELVATRDVAQVDATLPLVLAPLRRSRVESIGGLLLELLRDGPAEAVGLLWPHVANEVLLGVKHEEPRIADAMFELVGRIPEELLRSGLGRLASLDALRSGSVSEDLLVDPARELAGLLAELVESGKSEAIGHVLLNSFKSRPPARAAEIALAGFKTCVPSCRRLLVALLRDIGRGRPTRAANDVAGRILVESLERLGPHQREELSVREAIHALGGMRHRPARSVLNQILRERKGVLRAWPAPCRDAAQRALKALGVD